MNRFRPFALTLALLCAAGLSAGCRGGDSDVDRQILQQLAAIQDDIDELKQEVADLKTQAPTAAAPAAAAAPQRSPVPVQTAGYPSQGKNDAPVTIVEFTDYQCPFCRRHFVNTMPQIRKDWVDTGKVRYVLVDNPIPSHRYAAKAAEATHCAGDQGKFWEMHDHLFENQQRITAEALPVLAQEVGVDPKAFTACMDAGKHADLVQSGVRVAAVSGARGTPSFVIGKTLPDGRVTGEIVIGAKSYSYFANLFSQLTGG